MEAILSIETSSTACAAVLGANQSTNQLTKSKKNINEQKGGKEALDELRMVGEHIPLTGQEEMKDGKEALDELRMVGEHIPLTGQEEMKDGKEALDE
eukprot:672400_1